jgi:CubicO group peptidase (beta-lactamase class C family)
MIQTKFRWFFLFLFFWAGLSAQAQSPASQIDDWLAANVAKMGGRTLLLVYKDGKIIYNHAENELSLKQKLVSKILARRQGKTANLEDFTADTRQPVASCSKWYSAALVMRFADEGRLQLSDTVGKYLPVLSQHGKGNITISQCLSHMTGIQAPPLKENLKEMRSVSSMDEAIAEIADMPMEGEPGKVFHYSNIGLQIAGAILEKISGKSFETLFAENIARPLAMRNTDFGHGKVALPAGGAYSTPNDYMNFLIMILNKGIFNGKRILSEKAIADMQVNRVTPEVRIAYSPAEAGNFGYGYGEWVMDSNTTTHLSTSVTSPGLFGSFPWIDTQKNYAAILLCYYIRSEGRHERYMALQGLVDELAK